MLILICAQRNLNSIPHLLALIISSTLDLLPKTNHKTSPYFLFLWGAQTSVRTTAYGFVSSQKKCIQCLSKLIFCLFCFLCSDLYLQKTTQDREVDFAQMVPEYLEFIFFKFSWSAGRDVISIIWTEIKIKDENLISARNAVYLSRLDERRRNVLAWFAHNIVLALQRGEQSMLPLKVTYVYVRQALLGTGNGILNVS